MVKYYLVKEDELINLLANLYKMDALDRDGVDNWIWYGESFQEVINEKLSGKVTKESLKSAWFDDCAALDLSNYEYIEEEEEV